MLAKKGEVVPDTSRAANVNQSSSSKVHLKKNNHVSINLYYYYCMLEIVLAISSGYSKGPPPALC